MTLKFDKFLAVVKVHVHTKFHRVTSSASWVIVLTEKQKKTHDSNSTVVSTANSNSLQMPPLQLATQRDND